MKETIRAEEAGACYGVQRALDMALDEANSKRDVCTLGPLIHNPGVVAQLEECGVRAVSSVDEVPAGHTVIIRSHGVTPEVKRQILDRGLEIVDATCPHVARAQKAAATLASGGMTVIVVGEEGHPEVEGLVAHAREAERLTRSANDPASASDEATRVMVVATPADLPATLQPPVGVVVQTTQTRDALNAVLDALAARGIEPSVKDTICSATRKRQDAAAALARTVDACVVIGGRNSSNTTRLADICRSCCERTYHVEGADELDPAWFAGCQIIGVTAGASTPEDQVEAVLRTLRAMD